jgi:hypothetical protein
MKSLALAFFITPCLAGPFPPSAGNPGSDAIPASDPRITLWATDASVERGPANILFPDGALAGFGTESDATGPSDATSEDPYTAVSLGDGGSATLTFDPPFQNIPGPDFAVFENAFGNAFLELAFVEVSSDGETFFRFPATSLTRTDLQVGSFGGVDPTDAHNLAGKHPAGFGTPFDLSDLPTHPTVDLQRITHVRIIDVIGAINPDLASRDTSGNIINDPYPTAFFTGGFDLDAVGAFSQTSTNFSNWCTSNKLQPDWIATRNQIPLAILYATGNGTITLENPDTSPLIRFSRLTYRTNLTLHLEASENLHSWHPVATATNSGNMTTNDPSVTITETGSSLKSVSVQLTPNDPRRYFRLSATPSAP